MPPAGPFLCGQKGAKEPVKAGDSDFPRLNNPPLETAKKGELRFPLQKGAKEPVKAGDSDFPRLNNPPLETAKKGELRFPLLGTSPGLFCR